MAIQNPNSLYSAGAVTFNSQPATQFYLQSLARKRAKEEAMDNYFRDLGKGLTPAGMAPEDISEFMNKVNTYKQKAIQYRDQLRNPSLDNGRAYNEVNQLYNDALQHSAMSIGKVKNMGEIQKFTPEERERMVQHSWDAIKRASLPVSDPMYRPFNPADIEYHPKQFTLDDEAQMIQNLTKNRKMTTQEELGATNPKTFLRTKTTRNIYEPKEIQGMAQDAASEYLTNKSFKQKIDQLFEGSYNPTTGQVEIPPEYNEVFKSVYGKDIHVPQELAAAYALNKIQSQSVKTETEEDKFAQAKALERMKQANRIDILNRRHQFAKMDKKEQGVVLDDLIDKQIEEAKKQGATTYKDANGNEITEYQLKVSPQTKEIFATTDAAGKKIYPDVVRIAPNGDIHPIFFEKDTDKNSPTFGKIATVNGKAAVIPNLSQPISKEEYKLRLGKQLLSDKSLMNELDAEYGGEENSSEEDIPDFLRQK